MALDPNIVGTDGSDYLTATPGTNVIAAGTGDDTIVTVDGDNTILFNAGDGMDTILFAPARTYQYAGFLEEAQNALAILNTPDSDGNLPSGMVTDAYFGTTASGVLMSNLPKSIWDNLKQFKGRKSPGDSGPPPLGKMDADLARQTFQSLLDWINAPSQDVIQFGEGITAADLQLEPMQDANPNFGVPDQFQVSIKGQDGLTFQLDRQNLVALPTTGASTPPPLPITFSFADGTTMTLAELMSAPAPVNHDPVGMPTITGSATEDQTLTVNTANISDADGLGTFNYQWMRDGVAVVGATADTYTLGDADVNAQMSVQVGYSDGHGTLEAVTSAPTDAVANVNDTPMGMPTITGSATEDQTLTVNTANISDADGLGTFNYQWMRDGVAVVGATADTYTLGDADVNAQMSVQVGYSDGHGTLEAVTSAPTDAVANVNDTPMGMPTITGSATEDQTLTVNTANISDADGLGAFNYQWMRDGVAVVGATADTYKLGDADVNAKMSVQVGYTDGHGTLETVASAPTDVVANVNDAPVGVPTITGSATEDQTLTVNTANISDADGLGAFNYQWMRDGVAVVGATADTYKLGDADVNAKMSVQVGYSDGHGTLEAVTSAPTTAVANVNDAPVGVPTITGSATEDQTLTVNTANISDADGLGAFNYKWLRDGVAIDGATASTYTLGDADVGKQMRVQVSYVDGHGTVESISSLQTNPVANVNDAPQLMAPIADQSAVVGNTFTLTVPATAFRDIDVGDTLKFGAKLADGSALPSWLTFDPATRTLKGIPGAGAVGNMNLQIIATDTAGASVSDVFALNISSPPISVPPPANPPAGKTIVGGNGNDTLTGTAGNDVLQGNRGRDILSGGSGDDKLYFSDDASWSIFATRRNNGSPGHSGTGETVSIWGKRQSQDILDGGAGNDTLIGTDHSDAILLDDNSSPAQRSGPRIIGIEKIEAGAGNDIVDLTSQRYAYGDVTIDGGSGNDVLWSSSGNDVLLGGRGRDQMDGGAGNDYLYGGTGRDVINGGEGVDVLQGGRGRDQLQDTSGNTLLDGGSGDDRLTGGSNNVLFIGGKGDDTIRLGSGSNVVAFNRGDGRDVIESGSVGSSTLSLGAGIRLQDLAFRRSGDNLVLETGNKESITFDNWYSSHSNRAFTKLQFVTEGMTGSGGKELDDKVETFDFGKLVGAFDSARKANPGLSRWALTNGLASFHLDSMHNNSSALGGDLAYAYGTAGSLAGIGVSSAQGVLSSAQFGKETQALHPVSGLKEGLVKLA